MLATLGAEVATLLIARSCPDPPRDGTLNSTLPTPSNRPTEVQYVYSTNLLRGLYTAPIKVRQLRMPPVTFEAS
ncbi:hypothetical protein TNCV_2603391 [Trichonephila clavipes]|nr:hypothetical protein TNCV_2603391 [Trichonephila clavipes]